MAIPMTMTMLANMVVEDVVAMVAMQVVVGDCDGAADDDNDKYGNL